MVFYIIPTLFRIQAANVHITNVTGIGSNQNIYLYGIAQMNTK